MKQKRVMSKKKNFIEKQYSESWKFIKESKDFIYIAVLIFFITAVFAFVFPIPQALAEKLLEILREIARQTEGLSQSELMKFIFLNNVESSFFGMIFGAILGIFSVIGALFNGFLLGFVAKLVFNSEQGILALWRLFPHGIFELPAIFISLGLGIKFGTFIFQKKKLKAFLDYFWNCLRVFIFVVIPLLFIAAIIEGVLISLVG